MQRPWISISLSVAGLIFSVLCDRFHLIDAYVMQILMYIGINIILTASLNIVNGYMGEFSVGHAAFMAVGAYGASWCSIAVFPHNVLFFPLSLVAGGLGAALIGLLIAIPAFRARDDYLAIITLALIMIVKSVLENLPWLGGPQGYSGMAKYTSLTLIYVITAVSILVIRNLVYSNFGRGIIAVRDDEVAANLVSVDTKRTKILAFVISSFFAGIAGGLFAHLIQFINPRSFSIVKSTDILLMLYLGGSGTIAGSILGATLWTVLLEVLRFLGIWRFVVAPAALILLMIFRPKGIMGGRELRIFVPKEDTRKITRQEIKRPLRGTGPESLLRAVDVSVSFGGVRAVSHFSCTIDRGDICGIIGPNGAGKTSTFNLITGVYRPDSGNVVLDGRDITGLPSHVIVAKGISRTFQNIRLFRSMTVLDNVRTAAYCRLGYPLRRALLRTPRFKDMEREARDSAITLLEKFGLADRMHEPAADLPYGLQRKVELARALANSPSVLLLDEPGAGMNPAELDNLAELILWVREEFSCAVILIEHRMRLVMNICESVKVLNFGETIFDGKPGELATHEGVRKAYFGEDHAIALG